MSNAKASKSRGRPELGSKKKTYVIKARLTKEEYDQIERLLHQLGINTTDLIRMKVLSGATVMVINSKELISKLDQVGSSLGKTSNNINQLARYANYQRKMGFSKEEVLDQLNALLRQYTVNQSSLEKALRQILRLMSK